ncbi:MAG: DUF1553 domain-containing protein [Sumerlaeia bacterium]
MGSRLFFFTLLPVLLAFATPGPADLTPSQIDHYFEGVWQAEGLTPAERSSDDEFLRRLSLDVRGVVPSAEETIAFLTDSSPMKRVEVIEDFLASPERSEAWAAYWSKVLVGTPPQIQNPLAQQKALEPFTEWVSIQFQRGAGFDDFMTAILTAEGDLAENPAVLPTLRWRNAPESLAGTMSRAFLGQQIQCAQCHDSKENSTLTQKKFWELTAFFGGTRTRRNLSQDEVKEAIEAGSGMGVMARMDARVEARQREFKVVEVGGRWQTKVPDSELRVEPRYLDGTPAVKSSDKSRRAQLADFIERRDREQFAKNFVNRLWARYFGRGLMDPVDEWAMGREPDHPALLNNLAWEFAQSGYDVKHIERLILNSRVYQLSATASEETAGRPDLFACAPVRPLNAEQIVASLTRATGADGIADAMAQGRLGRFGESAPDLLMQRFHAEFVHTFDNDEMEWSNAFESSIPQALFLMNDETMARTVSFAKGSMLSRIGSTTTDPGEVTQYLYLSALSRQPSAEELERVSAALAASKSKVEQKALAEDVLWALVASTEFLTNH